MGEFKDHPIKIIIREQWCKPIIKHLRENLGYKLVYFGLPGLNGYDLECWIEYINYVVAIDCGDYNPKTWDYDKANEKIKELNSLLSGFERREEINGYSLYLGFLEEVVLKNRDKNGQQFSYNDSVHIFNLDFCNSLTVPLKIVVEGNVMKYYKSQVIRRLLELQRQLDTKKTARFIMFVTIIQDFGRMKQRSIFRMDQTMSLLNIVKH